MLDVRELTSIGPGSCVAEAIPTYHIPGWEEVGRYSRKYLS